MTPFSQPFRMRRYTVSQVPCRVYTPIPKTFHKVKLLYSEESSDAQSDKHLKYPYSLVNLSIKLYIVRYKQKLQNKFACKDVA